MRVHLDTDLGGDPDDACALAMLLGWDGVEIVGITTNLDEHGHRAGCVKYLLALAGREDVPIVSGAGASMTTGRRSAPNAGDSRFWPEAIAPSLSPPGAAVDLLHRNVQQGAVIIAIGALTNLARLEQERPGALDGHPVVFMGGWLAPPGGGLPAWGPEMDWNVQCDTTAAEIVASTAAMTLVTLPTTLKAPLRRRDLPRLRESGPIGALLARQSKAHSQDRGMAALGRAHAGLPDDLVNFHYDPVTCAVALGWEGASIEEMAVRVAHEGDVLRFIRDDHGRPTRVVLDIDGETFSRTWLACIETADRHASGPST